MALTTDRMAEIADYCKVEADDAQLPGFILAAAGTMQEAGVSEPEAGTLRAEMYLQCVKYLTLDLYDRRDRSLEGSVTENPAFRGLLNQLKMTEDVPDLGTSSGEG